MKRTKGLLLAATFSYGCNMANELKITQMLKEYADNQGKGGGEEEIKKALAKLIPYFFYRIIALANKIEDPFDIRVVKAHWIGNELLEKVKPVHIKQVFEELKKEGWDPFLLAFSLKPILKRGKYLHHNAYTLYNPSCSVLLNNEYFWHLGEARIKGFSEDLKNFKKYGGR